MIGIFSEADLTVTRSQVSDWLKKEEDESYMACEDKTLAYFLNGLINKLRGKKDGPSPAPEERLNNNLVLVKLKIALNLKAEDVIELMRLAGFVIGKAELSAFFRKKGHKHYKKCQDQILRNFLRGIQFDQRPESIKQPKSTWPGRTGEDSE
tara:strand:+ start:13259 stop:13714 length:456 start_codon:yes stop_codon:yes gene_type:complete